MNPSGAKPTAVSGQAGKRALKANKACVPCRARKTKCDAAEIGLPCSCCTSRQCVKDCVLPVRKGRARKLNHVSPIPDHVRSAQPSTSDLDGQSPRQAELDLFYLNILNDAGEKTTQSSRHHPIFSTPYRPSPEYSFSTRNCRWAKQPQLDDIDNEFLAKKGVFDLPPSRYLDSLVKTYFDHVYPFAPVINRVDFIRGYQSGHCSLFLLYVILAPASVHAPADVLSACGFASRSAAQELFFSKAKLLHDFSAEDDPLLMLQGSIILCMVILDHPTDRDFGYWFHNAIRLATKLDIRNVCAREDKPGTVFKLYRRIWWALYTLDIFHVSVNTRRSRLLATTSTIRLRTEDDWEVEISSEVSSDLLSPVTPQQRALPVVQCELSRIFGQCLSNVTTKPQQDPRQMFHSLDSWRKSLPVKMHMNENIGTDVYYLAMQAMGYRFECILCRLIRRCWQQTHHADWSEWVKQRLRSAILELDTITKRVLASGTLQDFPISFITTIIALLALHIESALDTAETDLVRSMAQISISQTMLVLTQGKEIPALKRALPLFEEILAKKNLYLIPPNSVGQVQDNTMVDADASLHTQAEQYENNPLLYDDFLGFDLLDEWQIGQMDFTGSG
ncbi:transcriptional regulator family: Fungal Specific TF [Penicillium roqueforti]|nr:transcriptional regulator family: Fungal Specific TF [Penicillium roqueforti]KAI3120701.1 transcriptional regulator family: Fungal Specific TF [Penicillium roqueforti]